MSFWKPRQLFFQFCEADAVLISDHISTRKGVELTWPFHVLASDEEVSDAGYVLSILFIRRSPSQELKNWC